MTTNLNTVAAALTLCISVAACVADESPERPELEAQLIEYVEALETNNGQALADILSRDLVSRIAEHGPAGSLDENLALFAERERSKLVREFPAMDHSSLSIVSTDKAPDGTTISAYIALDERILPRPFYFVLEDGDYKLSIQRPASAKAVAHKATEDNDYIIENNDDESHTVECLGNDSENVGANDSAYITCGDSSACGWFDGTRFTKLDGESLSLNCDYNSWGVDLLIDSNGNAACHDAC